MSQQNIDFGTFPDDPSADAIRTAFNKVQNNFDQLFGANANTTVTSINRTPGAGITVNFPTGNVVVSANLACLQVSTSSLKMGRGGNSGSNALITQSSQTLVIDINPDHVYSNYFADVNNGLSIFNGNLSSNSNYQPNLTSFGTLTSLNVSGRANFTGSNTYISSVSNLHIPGGGAGYTIVTDGAGNLSWSAVTAGNGVAGGNATEVQFQGSGGNLGKFSGNAGFTFTTGNGLLQTPLLTVAGNTISANFIGKLANGNSNISITGNSNITFTAISNSTMVISDTGANIIGTANISGNANVGNIGADQGIFTTSANIPLIQNGNSNVTIGANTTVSIFVAGNTTATISATTTGANISGIANVTGNIVTGGNISTTGTNGTVTANNQTVTGAATGNANVSTVTGSLGIRALASTYTDNAAAASATITNGAVHAIAQPTLTASNASVTFTNAATFYIANSPANSGSTTITNPYSLYIQNGSTYFGGANNYIAGNLTVAGNTTYYNVDSFNVEDPIISLGGGPNGNALTTNDGKDRGTALQYYTSAPVTAFMGWDNSNSEFSFGSNVNIASEVVTYNSLGNARGLTWLGNVDGSYANLGGNLTSANANLGNSAIANYFIGRLYGAANSIANGTSNVNISTTNGNVTIGVAGNASIMTVTGTGVNVAGTLNTGTGNANLGNLGTGTAIVTTGNITTINSGLMQNGNSNITITANANISHFVTGNTTSQLTVTATGANIPGTANVVGNANVGNLGTAQVLASANVTSPQFISNIATATGAPFSVQSTNRVANLNVSYANVSDYGVVTTQSTGTFYPVFVNGSTTGNYALGSNTLISANLANGALIATTFVGNITGNIGGILANGNSNVSIPLSNGNINLVAVGNTTLVITGTGANITGTANVSGNANVLNLGTAQILASANVTSPQFISNVAGGTAPFVVTSTTQVANLSVATAGTSGTVTTNAQPNITSVGTLTSLGVNGTITAANITANTGVFTGNGNGLSSLVGANVTGTVANATNASALLQNTSTSTTAYPTFTTSSANGNSSAVINTSISANLGNASITATTFVGALSGAATTAGTVTTAAQGNITSVGTLTGLGVNGTVTAANITANTGVFTGNGNGLSSIVGANVTGTVANATYAASAGSATTAGTVTTAAQPNITSVGSLANLTVTGNTFLSTTGGNVGIGTTVNNVYDQVAAQRPLVVQSSATSTTLNGSSAAITIVNGDTTTNNTAQLNFAAITGANTNQYSSAIISAIFGARTNGQYPTGQLVFSTSTALNSAPSEKMRIDSTGNVGIGNTAPTNTLSITGTTYVSGNSTIAGQIISSLASGTAPFSVQSTTRVANLNVAYSNVSDYGAITAQTTGTYYPVVISGATSGNYAYSVGPTGISFNLATNTVSATTFSGNVTASGTVQAANITATAFITRAVTTSISANGTTQAQATALTTEINIVSAVSVGTGVRLPAAVAGTVVYITNNSANTLLVYPQTNGIINSQAANAAFTQGANATLQYMAPTTTQWYTIGATYA